MCILFAIAVAVSIVGWIFYFASGVSSDSGYTDF